VREVSQRGAFFEKTLSGPGFVFSSFIGFNENLAINAYFLYNLPMKKIDPGTIHDFKVCIKMQKTGKRRKNNGYHGKVLPVLF
jgi:hypothetical protein